VRDRRAFRDADGVAREAIGMSARKFTPDEDRRLIELRLDELRPLL
jgi:hypothetical protein